MAAPDGEYTSAITAPNLPGDLAPLLVGINGLQPQIHAHKHIMRPQATAASTASFTPSAIVQAYGAKSVYTQGYTGSGQTIAIVIDTFPAKSDLQLFWANTAINQSINNITFIQAVTGTLDAASGEETLDTEWSSAMAPACHVRVYACTDLGSSDLDEGYQQVYEDVLTHPEDNIHEMSMSFGAGEVDETAAAALTDDQFFAELAAAGISLFASSGDGGSTPDVNGGSNGSLQVESPASDPNVTAVGGTSLFVNVIGAYTSETAWSLSGGGTSVVFGRPRWQTGTGVAAGNFRLVPDVCSAADPERGAVYYFHGLRQIIGGRAGVLPRGPGFAHCSIKRASRPVSRPWACWARRSIRCSAPAPTRPRFMT